MIRSSALVALGLLASAGWNPPSASAQSAGPSQPPKYASAAVPRPNVKPAARQMDGAEFAPDAPRGEVRQAAGRPTSGAVRRTAHTRYQEPQPDMQPPAAAQPEMMDALPEPRSAPVRSAPRAAPAPGTVIHGGMPHAGPVHGPISGGPMYYEDHGFPGDYGGGCDPCGGFCHDPFLVPRPCALYFGGEYLHFWTKDMNTPVLATTSPNGTAQTDAGVLGEPDTDVLLDGSSIEDNDRNGARFSLGMWLSPCAAIEINYFFLGESTTTLDLTTTGNPIIARPFFNTQDGAEDAVLVGFPNIASGTLQVDYGSSFQGGEVFARRVLCNDCGGRWDLLVGYRILQLDEDLRIIDDILGGPQSAAPNARVRQTDIFSVDNQFHGAELGVSGNFRYCGWTMTALMKLGIGGTRSVVNIDGTTTNTDAAGGTATGAGGVFAQLSNIGRYETTDFAVVPELGLTLGYDITCRLRATFGYTLIYWSRVARPGDQIDTDINPRQFFPAQVPVGTQRPQFDFEFADYWAQGITVGLEYRF